MHTRCQDLSRCISIVIGEGTEGSILGATDTRFARAWVVVSDAVHRVCGRTACSLSSGII
jgi:hypothetical protein